MSLCGDPMKHTVRKLFSLCSTACVLSLCTTAFARKVTIGLVSNFTDLSAGISAPYGSSFKGGIALALQDYAQKLQAKNIQIQIEQFDYGASDFKVLEVTRKALASPAVAVLGYNYSSTALLAAPILQAGRLPMITTSATANRLGTLGRYVHMASFDNAYMSESLVRVAKEKLKASTAVVITATNCAYCSDLAKSFEQGFVAAGGKVVATLPVLSDDRDFSEIVTQIKNLKSDVVFLPNQELTSARIIAAFRSQGLNPFFLGADGWGNTGKEFFTVLKGIQFSGYSVSHWHPKQESKKSQQFLVKYLKLNGRPAADTSVLAYDSMEILILALLKAKTLDREGVENALSLMKKHEGVSGLYEMKANRAPRKSLVLLQSQGNHFEYLETIHPKPVAP